MALTPELSNREQEVVTLLLAGKSNKQLAAALSISVRTVEFHLKNIYAKHQVGSRVELILKLGESTVADEGEKALNKGEPNARSWVTPLREALSLFGKELKMTSWLSAKAPADGAPLTFFDALRVCLAKYADFTGRASRPEFWWFTLFVTLVATALTYVSEVLASVVLLALLLPWLAVGVRRLRDSGQSGWWQLFLLVPVGGLVVLGFMWARPPVEPAPGDAATG